jgi:predicted transcriptional regulator
VCSRPFLLLHQDAAHHAPEAARPRGNAPLLARFAGEELGGEDRRLDKTLDLRLDVLNIQHVLIFQQPQPSTSKVMSPSPQNALSRRERQVMDIVYRRGRVSAQEVLDDLPDPPSYSAVRAALRLLEEKGVLAHELDGKRYVYLPTTPRGAASASALRHLVRTFFDGSPEQVVNALLEDAKPDAAELDRLAQLIENARQEGR